MHQHHSGIARYEATRKVTFISALINIVLGVLKIVFGVLGRSNALFADGLHSFADLLCDGAVWLAAYYAKDDADQDHPYGHNRFETVATFMLSVILVVVAVGITYDAVMRIINHQLPRPDAYTVIVAVISIFANEGLFRYTIFIAKKHNSNMLTANAWHGRADALSSVVVLMGILGSLAGLTFLDAVAAVLVALFIGKIGIQWFWQSFSEFTEKGLDPQTLQQIHDCIAAVDGVIETHQLRTRMMAEKVLLDVHLLIDSRLTASEGHHISESVLVALARDFPKLRDITIHVDVENHPHIVPKKLLPSRQQIRRIIDPVWSQFIDLKQIDALYLFYDNYQSIDMRVVVSGMSEAELLPLIEKFSTTTAIVPTVKHVDVLLKVS